MTYGIGPRRRRRPDPVEESAEAENWLADYRPSAEDSGDEFPSPRRRGGSAAPVSPGPTGTPGSFNGFEPAGALPQPPGDEPVVPPPAFGTAPSPSYDEPTGAFAPRPAPTYDEPTGAFSNPRDESTGGFTPPSTGAFGTARPPAPRDEPTGSLTTSTGGFTPPRDEPAATPPPFSGSTGSPVIPRRPPAASPHPDEEPIFRRFDPSAPPTVPPAPPQEEPILKYMQPRERTRGTYGGRRRAADGRPAAISGPPATAPVTPAPVTSPPGQIGGRRRRYRDDDEPATTGNGYGSGSPYPAAARPEPTYTEPGYTEPGYTEPGYTEPGYTPPAYPQPGYAQPADAAPGYTEPANPPPAYPEPGYAEPAYAEPGYTEPAAYAEPPAAYAEPPAAYAEPPAAYAEPPAYVEPPAAYAEAPGPPVHPMYPREPRYTDPRESYPADPRYADAPGYGAPAPYGEAAYADAPPYHDQYADEPRAGMYPAAAATAYSGQRELEAPVRPRRSEEPEAPERPSPVPSADGMRTVAPDTTGDLPRLGTTTSGNIPRITATGSVPRVGSGTTGSDRPRVAAVGSATTGSLPRIGAGTTTGSLRPVRIDPVVPAPRRASRWMVALASVGVIVLIAVCGLSTYFVFQDELTGSKSGNTAAQPNTPTPPRDISSRDVDPDPLTEAEVFPAEQVGGQTGVTYQVLKKEARTDCTQAATDDLAKLMVTNGCSQVVRGTLRSGDGVYLITAGIFNLKDADAAVNSHENIEPTINAQKGRFTGLLAGAGTEVLVRAPMILGWHARGHFLAYCVIARADGAGFDASSQPVTDQIQADILTTHLRDSIIGARTVVKASQPASGAPSPSNS